MSEEKGFLISVIIMLGFCLFYAVGEIKRDPCDFIEVGMYYDVYYEEMVECP